MAIEAERHAQRLGDAGFLHFMNRTVTFDTADPALGVNAVIEIRVVRHSMDSNPENGNAVCGAFADQSQPRILAQDLAVAIHAR